MPTYTVTNSNFNLNARQQKDLAQGITKVHNAVTGANPEFSMLEKYTKSHAHIKPNAFDPLSPRKTVLLSPRNPRLYIKNPLIAPTGNINGNKLSTLSAFTMYMIDIKHTRHKLSLIHISEPTRPY